MNKINPLIRFEMKENAQKQGKLMSFMIDIMNGNLNKVKNFLSSLKINYDKNITKSEERTIKEQGLKYAVNSGALEVVSYFLADQKLNINLEEKSLNRSLVILAIQSDQIKMASYLIEEEKIDVKEIEDYLMKLSLGEDKKSIDSGFVIFLYEKFGNKHEHQLLIEENGSKEQKEDFQKHLNLKLLEKKLTEDLLVRKPDIKFKA